MSYNGSQRIYILCHLATQLSPGDIITITLATKTKIVPLTTRFQLVSVWLE